MCGDAAVCGGVSKELHCIMTLLLHIVLHPYPIYVTEISFV